MKKTMTILVLMLVAVAGRAQWSVGLNAGADLDNPVVNTQYAYTRNYSSQWGAVLGVPVQYDFKDWLGLVGEPTLQYRQTHYEQEKWYLEDQHDIYLEFPVMVDFSFGGQKVRGFCQVGGYVGGWLAGWQHKQTTGAEYPSAVLEETDKRTFSDQDRRLDAGVVGGIGVRWFCDKRVSMYAEYRYYRDCVSSQKLHKVGNFNRYDNLSSLTMGIRFNQLGKK